MCFTVQLSKIVFRIAVCRKQLCYYIMLFSAYQELFSTFFEVVFCFSLAATLISYHIQPAVVKNFFISFSQLFLSDATRIYYHESFQMSRTFSFLFSSNAEGGI